VIEDEIVIPFLPDDEGRIGRATQIAVGDDAHQSAAIYYRQAPKVGGVPIKRW
jgi:hypothetical protein